MNGVDRREVRGLLEAMGTDPARCRVFYGDRPFGSRGIRRVCPSSGYEVFCNYAPSNLKVFAVLPSKLRFDIITRNR